MPKSQKSHFISSRLIPILVVIFLGCKNGQHQVPFPRGEGEFAQPISHPIRYSKPEPITWIAARADSIKAPAEKKFDLAQIPPINIDMEDFKPFREPPMEVKLDWDQLPDSLFNFERLPVKNLSFETFILPRPKHVKASAPHNKEGATTGLLQLGDEAGLTILSNLVYAYGILWFATEDGLCKFDGEYYDTYSLGDITSRNHINKIAVDKEGRVWLGTWRDGIAMVDPKAGTVQKIRRPFAAGNQIIFGLMCDSRGRIWAGSWGGGVEIIDPGAGTIRSFNSTQGLSDNHVNGFLEDSRGLIWVSTTNGANILNLHSGRIWQLNEVTGLSSNNIENFLEDKQGRVWIATRFQVNIVDTKKGTIKHIGELQGMSSSNTRALLEDDLGRIWVGTMEGGAEIIDEKNNGIKHMGLVQGLDNNRAYNFAKDSFGRIWIASDGGLNVAHEGFGNIRHLKIKREANRNGIYALTKDRLGRIWMGSDNSDVFVLDPATGTSRKISTLQGLSNSYIYSLLSDRNNQLWIAGQDGMDIIDQHGSKIRHFGFEQGLKNEVLFSLLEDHRDQIWLGGNGGLLLMNENGKGLKYLHHLPGTMGDTVLRMLEDKIGQVWVGTTRGLYVIDSAHIGFRHIDNMSDKEDYFITVLAEDSSGRIWAGSPKGLYVFNPEAGTSTHFTSREGLQDMFVKSLMVIRGQVFAGTGKGLTVISMAGDGPASATREDSVPPRQWKVKTFGKSQGFSDVNFHEGTGLVSTDGKLYWGFDDYLTVMDPPKEDSIIPPTLITGMTIEDKPQYFMDKGGIETNMHGADTLWDPENITFYRKGKLPYDSVYRNMNRMSFDSVTGPYNLPVNLKLPYDQNYLSFSFTGTQLADMDKTRYRYILEGIDKNWSAITEKSFTENYRDLSPGQYTFKVSSMGFNGRWSDPAELSFIITPPWWKTWWAYLIYAILVGAGLRSFVRFRSKRLLIEKHALEEKVNLRTAEVVRQKEEIAVQRDNLEQTLVELKNAQSQLVQSEKMASLGELTAGVAHEIQNPLNFVNNFSEVNLELIDEMKQDIHAGNTNAALAAADGIHNNLEKVIHHGKRADAIVKGMLQHSRTSTGQKEPTDINALADEYLRLSYHGLRAKEKHFNATLKTDFDEKAGQINIIPQDIGRVLLNLYNNAFYAVTQKKKTRGSDFAPTVSVSTKKSGGKLEIRVRDNGMGIPEDVVDKIFQPFFTTKPTGEGTGLGLSLSYDIITKLHDGQIKVATREGEYTEFIIRLPLA